MAQGHPVGKPALSCGMIGARRLCGRAENTTGQENVSISRSGRGRDYTIRDACWALQFTQIVISVPPWESNRSQPWLPLAACTRGADGA